MLSKFIHKPAQKISIFSGKANYARGLFLFAPIMVFAIDSQGSSSIPSEAVLTYIPWLTGPFLAPTPNNMNPKNPGIQLSVTIFDTYGKYNSNFNLESQESIWAINPLLNFVFGITDSIGVEAYCSFISNFKNIQSATALQDSLVLLGYQVLNDSKGSWIPDFRIMIQETFPTGKYQKLDPDKEGIDSTGFGSFQTGPVVAIYKLFYLPKNFLSLELSIGYLFPTSVSVSGFNAYGGGYGTNGVVLPGQTLNTYLSLEYSINQRWVFAFEWEAIYQGKCQFTGDAGVTSLGKVANTELPSSLLISFAPELEYNFSAMSGLIGGLWFSVAGRNSDAFASAFLSFIYIF